MTSVADLTSCKEICTTMDDERANVNANEGLQEGAWDEGKTSE